MKKLLKICKKGFKKNIILNLDIWLVEVLVDLHLPEVGVPDLLKEGGDVPGPQEGGEVWNEGGEGSVQVVCYTDHCDRSKVNFNLILRCSDLTCSKKYFNLTKKQSH